MVDFLGIGVQKGGRPGSTTSYPGTPRWLSLGARRSTSWTGPMPGSSTNGSSSSLPWESIRALHATCPDPYPPADRGRPPGMNSSHADETPRADNYFYIKQVLNLVALTLQPGV
jgi:hypothetical protein